MPDSSFSPHRLLISYSRTDGRDFAELFEKRIAEHDLKSWRDLKDVEGGEDIRPQVLRAIEKAEHLVLILTRRALVSDWVKREWTHARQNGVKVSPVLADPEIKRGDLPSWARRADIYDIDEPERWNKLIQVLKGPGKTRRVPYMTGPASSNYVQRCAPYERLKKIIMDKGDKTVALTTALQGAGGYGKTTLANALCRDEDVQFEFSDGIIRVEVGKERLSVLPLIRDMLLKLAPEYRRLEFEDEMIAAEHLGEVLGEARVLLVIDDIWRECQLAPFLLGGKNCMRLVTTRIPCVLPPGSASVPVDEMRPEESLDLLAWKLPVDDPDLRVRLAALARRLVHWAQLLEMANGWLRGRIGRGEPLGQAIDKFDQRLTNKGLTAFDPKVAEQRNRAVAACIETSLEDLSPLERERFETLAILPEDEAVPLAVVEALWMETEKLELDETEDFLDRLASLSLLQRFDLGNRTIRLHDNILWYLKDNIGAGRETQSHGAMAETLVRQNDGDWTRLPAENVYGWRFGLRHLRKAGRQDEVDELLTDYAWIKQKLALRGAQELWESYLSEATGPDARFVGRAVALSVPTLFKRPDQLGHQFWGRLAGRSDSPCVCELVTTARIAAHVRLKPRWAGLTPPGRELLRLVGHKGGVTSASFSPDGRRIVTASLDATARVWDAATGAEQVVLRGHADRVTSAAFSPDGFRIATASADTKVLVWDADMGGEPVVLQGHEAAVTSVSFSTDGGRIVTASDDKTARVWDAANGRVLAILRGHKAEVAKASFSTDGCRIATASWDTTARVWDAATGEQQAILRGHKERVTSVSFAANGHRIVTASSDKTGRVWDVTTETQRVVLRGHKQAVRTAFFSAHGNCIVTASRDKTARIWDAVTGAQQAVLRGHDAGVTSACFSVDSRYVVTTSWDMTAKVWDVGIEIHVSTLNSHDTGVISTSFSADGRRVVTVSRDNAVRLWNSVTGEQEAVLRGHKQGVDSATFSGDGDRIVTASRDKTARVWDTATGELLFVLRGHKQGVNSAIFSADSCRIVTASRDKTARVWNSATGAKLLVLRGHKHGLSSVSFSTDGGRIVTASRDTTARVWDAATGALQIVLSGHRDVVNSACFSRDGAYIVTASRDSSALVWNAATGALHISLIGHKNAVTMAFFSADGDYIVTVSQDMILQVWNTETGFRQAILRGHESEVTGAFFSKDGQRIVTVSVDKTVRVWDAVTGIELDRIVFDTTLTIPDVVGNAIAFGDNLGKMHVVDFHSN